MDWVIEDHTAEALLMQFSEWLDVEECLLVDPCTSATMERTHEQLVREFIANRNPQARPKVLA
jgi:hypothetical protein